MTPVGSYRKRIYHVKPGHINCFSREENLEGSLAQYARYFMYLVFLIYCIIQICSEVHMVLNVRTNKVQEP